MSQDLEAGSGLLGDLLCSSQLLLGVDGLSHTLLQRVEDGAGGQHAGRLVGEGVVVQGEADHGVGHLLQSLHVHGRGQEQPGDDVVEVVHGGCGGQLPPQLL